MKKRKKGQLKDRVAYTVEEVAEMAGVGRNTIYNATRTGELVARKAGTRTLILKADVMAFLKNLPKVKP